MANHILVVEDEPVTRAKLVGYFEHEGYRVSSASNGDEMRNLLQSGGIDLVMLDINLPGEDGLMLTRTLRSQSDIGIILVTGRTDSIDRIVGLEMGADDYVTKPFELRELLVRVKNLLWRIDLARRAQEQVYAELDDESVIRFGDWRFDIDRRALLHKDQPVKLTKAEYELLVAFATHANRVLSRERILNMISHRVDAPNDRTIDVLVRRLRRKIEKDPKNPQRFITVHGEGYLFVGD
ncbi:TorCAD operon transcriptional regulatory protein TorR [Vibrio stylophorae]|uniref:TorCAD operon transcriptional regulatory protein TorR n=1 Tax=Vibrio stylophorae TaxID=659351 RepID=A0ABM8ZRY3_9VIBR|nr:two-component system response regulator TorR [Vibrio stylophorae]CAH0533053.1 TorCAD operon transcriptional regulatory protein TorR [Vibrio stylophorae]